MPNPWDVPALSEPDTDEDDLYKSVGRALSAWEGVEHHLATFFGFFATGGGDDAFDAPARRAYGSVISFQGRSSMLAAAAEIYFAFCTMGELEHMFDDLLVRANKFSARRNEIAHGIVQMVPHIDEGGAVSRVIDAPSARRWVLVPSPYATNKHKLLLATAPPGAPFGFFPKYIYSSTEINGLAARFSELEQDAFDLMMRWGKEHPESWPAPCI